MKVLHSLTRKRTIPKADDNTTTATGKNKKAVVEKSVSTNASYKLRNFVFQEYIYHVTLSKSLQFLCVWSISPGHRDETTIFDSLTRLCNVYDKRKNYLLYRSSSFDKLKIYSFRRPFPGLRANIIYYLSTNEQSPHPWNEQTLDHPPDTVRFHEPI